MSATTVGCRCTSKRKCPWTSCTPRAPSPSPSSAPSAACGKCSRCDSRPDSPPRTPAFAPGAGAPTVRPPAPAPVSCRSTAHGAKAEPNPNHRAYTLRTRGGYRPGSCAGSGSCRSTAHGAKAEPNHNPRAYTLRTRGGCSYNKLVEVLGGVPFGHLFVQLAPGTVDLAAALYCGPYGDLLGPAHEVGIALRIEEFGGAVHLVGHYAAIPGPDGHVGDAVLVPGDIGVVGQLPIEHV